MATKILGIVASAAIIALIAITFLHRDRFRSLLPEPAETVETAVPAEMPEPAAPAELPDSTITADTLPTTPDNNL